MADLKRATVQEVVVRASPFISSHKSIQSAVMQQLQKVKRIDQTQSGASGIINAVALNHSC